MFNYKLFAEKCLRELPLKEATSNYKPMRNCLPVCILDAVFSMGVKYTGVVRTVDRYLNYFHLDRAVISNQKTEHTVSEFISNINSFGGVDSFVNNVLKNRQRTSTTNGILKADACYQFAQILQSFKINTLEDLYSFDDKDYLNHKIKSIKGQSSGIMLNYFYMLAGDTTIVKEDRWIFRYVQEVIPEAKTKNDIDNVFKNSIEILKETYPNITITLLDNVIWTYMSKFK